MRDEAELDEQAAKGPPRDGSRSHRF
jgi:hypothetical protein